MRYPVTERRTHLPEPEMPAAPGRSLRVVRLSSSGFVVGHTDDGRACLLGVVDRASASGPETIAARPQGSELLEVIPLLDELALR